MVNTPIPHNLEAEAKKAAKILKDFTIPDAHAGPDKVIPAGLVEKAAGLAILTVAKLGFLVTARAGSGIVIAKLHGGRWSAPSAIGIAGLGGGFEAGAEVTDFVLILYSKQALDAFSHGGNLTLGGNVTIAAGPLGRNLEGDVSLRSPAAVYTYSKTRGLFAGISIEGSALIERKDANKKFYGRDDVRAWHMLGGVVEPPPQCDELYQVLRRHREMYEKALAAQAKKYARRGAEHAVNEGAKQYGATGMLNKIKGMRVQQTKRTTSISKSSDGKTVQQTYRQETYTRRVESQTSTRPKSVVTGRPPRPLSLPDSQPRAIAPSNHSHDDRLIAPSNHSPDNYSMARSSKSPDPEPSTSPSQYSSIPAQSPSSPRAIESPVQSTSPSHWSPDAAPSTAPYSESPSAEEPWQPRDTAEVRDTCEERHEVVRARALYSFTGQMPCDLSFSQGEVLEVLTRTRTQDDWWEGRLGGHVGIFPANYVSLLDT